MIVDRFENLEQYFDKNSKQYKAICFARDYDMNQSDGRFEISGEDIYATSATYVTKLIKSSCFEDHRIYADVHVMLEGEEFLGHSTDKSIMVLNEYNEETDLKTYARPESYNSIILKPGSFVVFYPQDLHMPNCAVNEPKTIRKLVMKIRVSIL